MRSTIQDPVMRRFRLQTDAVLWTLSILLCAALGAAFRLIGGL